MEAKFEVPLEWWVDGTPDSVEAIFRRTAEDLRRPGFAYSVENSRHRSGVPTLTIRVAHGEAGGPIGQVQVVGLPGERTSMRVPKGRGSINPRAWDTDLEGTMFATYIDAVLAELARSGFNLREPSAESGDNAAPHGPLVQPIIDAIPIRLEERGFLTTLTHFRHAMSALQRGEWESANAQTRAFLESLCDDIALALWGPSSGTPKAGLARAYLQDQGVLDEEEGDLLRAFFKVLHGEGSHPGTSDADDATRRLVMASSLANYYLERLGKYEEEERRRKEEKSASLMRLERFAESVLGPLGSESVMGEYESPDWNVVDIEDETVIVEADKDYGVSWGHERGTLGQAWVAEFTEVMTRWGNDYCLVLTEKMISEDIKGAVKIDDGLYELSWPSTVLVEVPPDSYDDAAANRIRRARDRLAEIILRDRENRPSPSQDRVSQT